MKSPSMIQKMLNSDDMASACTINAWPLDVPKSAIAGVFGRLKYSATARGASGWKKSQPTAKTQQAMLMHHATVSMCRGNHGRGERTGVAVGDLALGEDACTLIGRLAAQAGSPSIKVWVRRSGQAPAVQTPWRGSYRSRTTGGFRSTRSRLQLAAWRVRRPGLRASGASCRRRR